MKVILSSVKNEFWIKVVNKLSQKNIEISYWVGEESEALTSSQCSKFVHINDILNLSNKTLANTQQFDFRLLSIKDYYNYLKILDRADCLGGFSFSKRDRTLKNLLDYWYTTLSQIEADAIIFSNVPHLQYDYPLYLVAKHMGLKILMFNMTPYSDWCYATFKISNDNTTNLIKVSNKDLDKISRFEKTAVRPYKSQTYTIPTYMKKQIDFDKKRNKRSERLKDLYKKINVKIQEESKNQSQIQRQDFFTHIGENKLVSIIGNFYSRSAFHKRLRKTYNQCSATYSEIDGIKKYIYVPLHYQPEATTAPLGGIFSDQIYMIKHLRTLIPNDTAIVVKEHYSQFTGALNGYLGRDLDYWTALLNIKNVYLAPLDYNPKKLIIESTAVATVTGTAGWEAIQFGKYCILYGAAWYSSHPYAINYESLNAHIFNNIMNNHILTDRNDEFLDTFCDSLLNINLHVSTKEPPKQSINEMSHCIINFLKSECNYVNK